MGRGGEEGGGGGRTCCIVLVYWTTGVTPAGQASKYWLILTGDHTTPGWAMVSQLTGKQHGSFL